MKPLSLALACVLLVPAAFASISVKRSDKPKTIDERSDRYIVVQPHVPGVTLDVKDEEVHRILKTMQEQCAIKNLIIDPDVHGNGTFLFHDVPCRVAFDTVFRTLGLGAVMYENSVVTVSGKR